MQYREFGKTGLKVSEIGFGCWAIGGNAHGKSYGHTDDKTSLLALQRAIELGCNFFDTADVYGWGHSEELLGKVLKSKRDRLIVATKVGADFYQGEGFQTFTPDYIRFALEKSLKRLKTDYVDVYQLHNPPLKLINQPSTYEPMLTLKREGKIRAWGLSVFDPIEGLVALKVGRPDSLQLTYNIFNSRGSDNLLPIACQLGCAIIAREPLANGFLCGKYLESAKFEQSDMRESWRKDYVLARAQAARKLEFLAKNSLGTMAQVSLRYVLADKAISVTIPGCKTPEQAEENCRASDLSPLPLEDMRKIAELRQRQFDL
jgi:aryl-alcohol dehydrogenase-like predicted oxidoreductase